MHFVLCFWYIPQTRGIMPMMVLKYHVQKLMHVAIRNGTAFSDMNIKRIRPELESSVITDTHQLDAIYAKHML